ncbi:MAG: flagellar hook-length control protein FliK [bacterium]|nr:flagellar hook-length control protein FliK [bacterium]
MEIPNLTVTHKNNSSLGNSQISDIGEVENVSAEFAEILGTLSNKGKKSDRIQDEYLASMFVVDPMPKDLAARTAEIVSKEQSKREVANKKINEEQSASNDSDNKIDGADAKDAQASQKSEINKEAKTESVVENRTARVVSKAKSGDSIKSNEVAEAKPQVAQANTNKPEIDLKQLIAEMTGQGKAQIESSEGLNKSIQKVTQNDSTIPEIISKTNQTINLSNNIAGLIAEITKSVILDANTSKLNKIANTAIENLNRIDQVAAKTKESSVRNEVDKNTKALLTPKDMQQTINKVEEALKEAIRSKDGKSVSLRLDPPSLGSIKVEVTLKEGGLYARIVSDSSQVSNFLREKGGDLQQVLRKMGLNLDQVNVFVGSENGSSQEFQSQTNQQQGNKSALRLVTQENANITPQSLVAGLFSEAGQEAGWVA